MQQKFRTAKCHYDPLQRFFRFAIGQSPCLLKPNSSFNFELGHVLPFFQPSPPFLFLTSKVVKNVVVKLKKSSKLSESGLSWRESKRYSILLADSNHFVSLNNFKE